jgi:hypothetical protein
MPTPTTAPIWPGSPATLTATRGRAARSRGDRVRHGAVRSVETPPAEGAYNVFPTGGFTVTADLYLPPSSAQSAGQLVDSDIGLNNSNGTYGIDNVITSCYENAGTS